MHDSHEEVQGATRLNSRRGPSPKEHRSVQAEVGLRVAFRPFAVSFQVQKGYRKSFQVLAMSGLETVAEGIQHRRARGATVVCHDDSTTQKPKRNRVERIQKEPRAGWSGHFDPLDGRHSMSRCRQP